MTTEQTASPGLLGRVRDYWNARPCNIRHSKQPVGTREYFGTISFGKQWSPKVGLFAQTAHGNEWGETVVGPSFAITEELQVSVAVGAEHYAPNPARVRLNAYYDDIDTGSFAYVQFDTGKDSSWVWVDATRMFKDVIGVGLLVEMPGTGAGPKLELRAGKHLGFWVAPVYEWREKAARAVLGGRVMFQK